ncbi:235 kDa rhoptry protein [Plasmodium yoelii yoelii]|uniref:235 kDa rhoptry protein n=1 Tax=Plasmodium yoelii yoelii TaxID=73239 RepID=Q7RQB6_PLAYO|nr:235 kDa rhoptry protein [Plasmodium yoelii yoelii]
MLNLFQLLYLGVIYGKKIEAEKRNHDAQLNNFYSYHNSKGVDFNNSNSSNEEQCNNQNNVINDKFIQPHSITYLENQKDTANDKITLYNDYTNKNDFDTFKSFNNENEQTNRKETIVKSSFIQNFVAPPFDHSLYNIIDIVYGVSIPTNSLSFFYVRLRVYQEIRDILHKIYSNATSVINIPRSKHYHAHNDIQKAIKECEPLKKKVINEMFNFQSPLYEFYKEPVHGYYDPYAYSQFYYANCMVPQFKKLEPVVEKAFSSMMPEYDYLCYYEYWNVDAIYKNYSTTTKDYMVFQMEIIKKYPMFSDNETVPYIKSLIKILESENEQASLKKKLFFLEKQFEDIISKSYKCRTHCVNSYQYMQDYVLNETYTQYYYNYLKELKKIAASKALFIYNSDNLQSMEKVYNYQKEVLNRFIKTLGKLLIEKPDPDNNQILKDDIDEFDISTPKSKLTELETKFFEIFKEKWDSYDIKKTLDKNGNQYDNMKLILQRMTEFKDIIDSMKLYKRSVVSKNKILSEIDQKLNKQTYKEIENGLKESYILAKDWKRLKRKIRTELEGYNEDSIKLEKEINDLFDEYLEINNAKIYLSKLKIELKEKIKNISDKNEYVKKAIDLKKIIKNNNAYIDELAKASPYKVTEYVNNKDKIYSTIESELSKIYEGDIDELYNELSSIVKENDIDNAEDKTKLEDLKSKIYKEYNKIQNMETKTVELKLSTIENSKNELLTTTVKIKKYIYEELNNEINKIVEDFKNKENQLSSNINEYSKYNEELNKYKSKISEIKNNYNDQSNIDNINDEEAKQNYDQYKEYTKTISIKEDEIDKTINEMKRMKDDILNKVNVFTDLENNHKEKVNSEQESFIELVNKIKSEISYDQLNNYESKFNVTKSLIIETNKSIEVEYKNIDTLKKINGYLKICKNTKESIKKLSNKQNELNEILNKNIETIKNCNLIEKSYTDQFNNALTDKKKELEKTFTELSLNNYEANNDELITYFNNLKKNLGNFEGDILYQQLSEKEKTINDIEQKNVDANKNVSNIEIVIHTSIYNISDEIEKLIGNNAELLNKEIFKEAQISITNLNEIKDKLKNYNFNDLGKDINIKNDDEVTKIQNEITVLNTNISQNIDKLEDIKKKSENYVAEIKAQIGHLEDVINKTKSNDDSKKIENKQEIIVSKIDKHKNIYENMNKLVSEITEIKNNTLSLKNIQNINLSYEKSLNKLFLDQINKEKTNSENMIKSIEKCKTEFDDIKNKQRIADTQTANMQYSEYKEFNITIEDNDKYFSDISEKSLKLIKEDSEKSNINDIKKTLQGYLLDAQKRNSDINRYLSEITNLYNILKSNNIKNMIDDIKNYAKQIEEYNQNVKSELDKSETLIKTLKGKLQLEKCKSKIESTTNDKDAVECIKDITESKNYILNDESNINDYFKKAEEYNENLLLNFKNIEAAYEKAQYMMTNKSDSDTNNNVYNSEELKGYIDKSKGYKDEVNKNTKTIENNKKELEKYKNEAINLLNKFSEFMLKNKIIQTKKDLEIIINEIKKMHKESILQADKSEQKINTIKNEQIQIKDDTTSNDKSNKAIIGIQASLDKFETKFLKINDIRTKSNNFLKETENIEKQISNLSINSQEIKLKDNEDILNTLQKFFESLKDQKKNIEDQKTELDNFDSEIENIESDVSQNKKNYEMGIIEKIKENADTNKNQIESTKELIKPTIENLISSFNTNDLEGINTNENLEKYNIEMNKTYNEFMESYNLIADYLKTVSKESITYGEIKNTRITAQNALLKNIESEKKSKSYLDDVKIKEFDRIITHFKAKLDNVNDKFTNEYSNINKGLDDISKYIENVKNSTDENSLLDTLNQTKNTYMGMIGKSYYNYKHEAENIFKNMVKLAYSLNIQIQNNSGIYLLDNINIAILSSLDSETKDTLKFIPSPQNESEIYKKIRNSYDTLLDIFKKSQDTHKKEQYTLNLMEENRHLYEKIHASNELKGALSDTKYKKEKISNDIKLVLHKFNELNQLTCDFQNDDIILELSKQNQIKSKVDNYEQEKKKLEMDFNVTIMEEKLNNIIKTLEQFENNHDSSEGKGSNTQSNEKLNDMTKVFNAEIKTIEDKIIEKNKLIDKLIEMRKDCLLFTYTTLVETLKSKTINYSEFITSVTKVSKAYLEYIKNSTDSLNDDIDTLQTKYNLNKTNKHMTSNITHITNDNNNLIEKEEEATQIINNLTKLFTIDSNNIDVNTLHNNKLQMTYFYSQLQKSIESIKQLYRKIRAFKLSNIYLINEKYLDISKQFDNILQLQKNKLTESLNNLNQIDQYISDKKNKFLHAISETTPDLNTVKEIYHDIVNRESQVHEIENISNKENQNITLYIDTITQLTEKIQNILNFVTTNENDNNTIKQHIQDIDEKHVSKIIEILKSTIQSFQQIKNKIYEIKTQFYDNNNINNIISTISQHVNDVKSLFSMDLTIENELIQIQNRLKDIKNATRESRSEQIDAYINTMHNYVEQQFNKIENNPNKNEIDNTMENIQNYNKESEVKLQQISNYKNQVASIITDITNLIALIKPKYDNNNNNITYKAAIKHEEDAQKILNDLNKSQNILNQSINQNKKNIEYLGYKKQGNHNYNSLHNINNQQEISEIKYPSNTHYNNINNEQYKNQHHSNSGRKGYSKTTNAGDSIRYAGAIALGLVVCYAISIFKKQDEKNEMDLDNDEKNYGESENIFFQREDEIIEININEDLF